MMSKYMWIHSVIWTAICLFGVFMMSSEGMALAALIFAIIAVAWIPSRIWIWQKTQKEDN